MRIVNGYVMDQMDDLTNSITNIKKVKGVLEEALDDAYYNFANQCEARDDEECNRQSDGKCLVEKCPYMKKVV